MNLQEIALRGEWRELVTPGLRGALERLEMQGMAFFWTHSGQAGHATYVFNASIGGTLIASHDGSEMPRQAISEVILGAMTAQGIFPQQMPVRSARTRRRSLPVQ
ncbi:MAG: hypothetical protein AB1511_12530 [Deinococcota bacterium]